MKKKKILLYADAFNGKVGQTLAYMAFFDQFGEVVLVHSKSDIATMMELGDILALPGGADVDAGLYNEAPGFTNSRANVHYEYLDQVLLKPWLEQERPIIAICRGTQALNVALGGTLHQEVIGHAQSKDRYVRTETMYTDVKGFHTHEINSMHHQAIKDLGKGLSVVGWSSAYDGCYSLKENTIFMSHIYDEKTKVKTTDNYYCIIEAVRHDKLPIVGFQYHPEEFNCNFARKLITEYIL